jgi:hypothetical protein
MIDLSSCTFMIPVRIESTDRYYNLKAILGYLNHHFVTNVKLYEVFSEKTAIDFLDQFNNLSLEHTCEHLADSEPFHRTKYLNFMLSTTTTEIVSNYDADVLLPVEVYKDSVDSLLQKKSDFIYPYILGEGQKKLHYSKWYEDKNRDLLYWSMLEFLETYNLKYLDEEDTFISHSLSSYGHCFFARTESYKSAFGENENFISYGPEDVERAHRFKKLGYTVLWWDSFVYHLEHERTADSSNRNLYWDSNNTLFDYLSSLNKEQLLEYYCQK